jgi:hypothetical protein
MTKIIKTSTLPDGFIRRFYGFSALVNLVAFFFGESNER